MLTRSPFLSLCNLTRFAAAFFAFCIGAPVLATAQSENAPILVRTKKSIAVAGKTYEAGTWLHLVTAPAACPNLPPDKYCSLGAGAARGNYLDNFPIDKTAVEPLEATMNIHWLHGRVSRSLNVYTIPKGNQPVQPSEFKVINSLVSGADVSVSGARGPYYEIHFIDNHREYTGLADKPAFDIVDGPPPLLSPADRPEPVRTVTPPAPVDYTLYIEIAAGLALLGGLVALGTYFGRNRMNTASTYPEGFPDNLKARFPANRIFFVPENIRQLLKVSPKDGDPAYRENCDDWWKVMMKQYPNRPDNEVESKEREASFWQMYARHFTVLDSAQQPVLWAKQDILDFFQYWEKWIFRYYFAATGTVHKTIIEEAVRLIIDVERASEIVTGGHDARIARRRQEVDKAIDARDNFFRVTMPAHFKEWGGWFLFHVEEAFQAEHGTESGYGPQSAESSSQHPAQDDISYRPNS